MAWGWFNKKQSEAGAPAQPGAEQAAEVDAGQLPGVPSAIPGPNWAPTTPLALPGALADVARDVATEAELRHLAALRARGAAAWQYLADTAARICEAPVAAITLVQGDALHFRARVGFAEVSAPAAGAPSLLALARSPALTVLDDLSHHPAFSQHPMVRAHPRACYYAAAPIVNARGRPMGTVSVMDVCPRNLQPVQLRTLQLLARHAALLLAAEAAQPGEPEEPGD